MGEASYFRQLTNLAWVVFCVSLSTNFMTATAYSDYCGGFSYNPTEQSCCGTRIYSVPTELGYHQCCGDELFLDDGTWQCCGNKRMELSGEWMCCNNEIINSTTYQCCDNRQKHARQEGHECCGSAYYNTETQTCCDGAGYRYPHAVNGVGTCCGSGTYDATSQICCPLEWSGERRVYTVGKEGVMLKEAECCGDGWYNKTTHVCCGGVRQERQDGYTACHNTQAYDPTKKVVCGRELRDIMDGKTHCCVDRLFNPNNETCCEHHAAPSPFSCCGIYGATEKYLPTDTACVDYNLIPHPEVNGLDSLWRTCGGEHYPDTLQICCGNQLFEKYADSSCCGNEVYRSGLQHCLNAGTSLVLEKLTPDAQLCNPQGGPMDQQFDPMTQTCCRDPLTYRPPAVFNGTEGECCRDDSDQLIFTDPSQQTCCQGMKVHPFPRGSRPCCGPELLDPGRQLCDDQMQEVVDIPVNRPDDNAVCVPLDRATNPLIQTYQNDKEYCSSEGFIVPMPEGLGRCGDEFYNPQSHACCYGWVYRRVTSQCCNGRVQPLFDDDLDMLQCCLYQAYNNKTSSCLHENLLHGIAQRDIRMCGSRVYDSSKLECRGGTDLAPRGSGQHTRVCGSARDLTSLEVYDDREQECCGERLIGPGQTCCQGFVYQTPGTSVGEGRCCINTGYNPSTHICCMDTISPVDEMEDPACCFSNAYDRSLATVACCGRTLQQRTERETECSEGVVHSEDEVVCSGVRHPAGQGECCGTDLYQPETELCCGGFKYSAEGNNICCGNIAHQNASGTLCCSGTLYENANGKACCDHAAYDPASHECFATGGQDYVIEHLESITEHNRVFCRDGSYDPEKQTCCDGLLYNGLRACCGNNVINDDTRFMCCNENIVSKMFGEMSQCCASGQVVHAALGCEGEDSRGQLLCNGSRFFPAVQGCCEGALFSLDEAQCVDGRVLHWCGYEAYSKAEQTCCNGSLSDAIAGGECCEGQAFDPVSHVCCGGAVKRVRKGRTQCCGSQTYNLHREMCCESGPVRLPHTGDMTTRQRNSCCGKGFTPNLETRRCEELPELCLGLQVGSSWREAADDCTKDLAFQFVVETLWQKGSSIAVNITSYLPLALHDSNIHLRTLILPPDIVCPDLREGRTYAALSSGDLDSEGTILLNGDDFLTTQPRLLQKRLLNRDCS